MRPFTIWTTLITLAIPDAIPILGNKDYLWHAIAAELAVCYLKGAELIARNQLADSELPNTKPMTIPMMSAMVRPR